MRFFKMQGKECDLMGLLKPTFKSLVATLCVTSVASVLAQTMPPSAVQQQLIEPEKPVIQEVPEKPIHLTPEEKVEEKKLEAEAIDAASSHELKLSNWHVAGIVRSIAKVQDAADSGNLIFAFASVEHEMTPEVPFGATVNVIAGTSEHRFRRSPVNPNEYGLFSYGFPGNPFEGSVTLPFNSKLAANGPTVTVGRLDSPMGIDNAGDGLRAVFTGPYLYRWNFYPDFHNGLYVSVPLGAGFTAQAYGLLGWNGRITKTNKERSAILRLHYKSDKGFKPRAGLAWYIGREGSTRVDDDKYGGIMFANPGLSTVNVGNIYGAIDINPRWAVSLDAMVGHASGPNHGTWYGGTAAAAYNMDEKNRLGFRFDYVDDRSGVITQLPNKDNPGTFLPLSGTGIASMIKHKLSTKSDFRLELRYNFATHRAFRDREKDQFVLTAAQVYIL